MDPQAPQQTINTIQSQINEQTKPTTQTCKYCKNLIPENVFFCPVCGKKLKNPLLSTSIGKQLSVYAISLLLPPLGLVPGIQYLLSKDRTRKIIGIIAIVLTIISLVVSTIYLIKLYNNLTKQFNDLQNLGY